MILIWQKIDKQYRGNFWNKILTILSNQEQKGRINSDYNIDRFSQDNVDKIPNDEKKKLVFSETDLDVIATLLWIKESDINTLPYAHKDFNGQWIQYGRYKDQYWKVVWEFKNGVITWKWACIRSSWDKYIWGWEHGEMSWTGNYIIKKWSIIRNISRLSILPSGRIFILLMLSSQDNGLIMVSDHSGCSHR